MVGQGRVPDEFEVIATPRRGDDVVHRVLVLLDPARPVGWSTPIPSPAEILDPLLATWVSRLLLDPTAVRIAVAWVDDAGTGFAADDFAAAELGLGPLQWPRMAADPAELRQRIAQVARDRWTEPPPAATRREPAGRTTGHEGSALG